MVIASLHPLIAAQDNSMPIFDWGFIYAFQQASVGNPHDYYVFLPHGCQLPDSMPIGPNVHIKSTVELADFFQEFQVDVWHDFGYTPAFHLAALRHLSGQNFPITVRVEPSFLAMANTQLTPYSVLSNRDALVCSRMSIHQFVEAVNGQSEHAATQETGPQIHEIPLGVKSELIDANKKRDARYLLRLPGEMTIVLCLAEFSPNTSMDLLPLIRAFQTIAENHEEVLLVVSGSDEYRYADRVGEFLKDSPLHRRVLLRPNVGESAQSLLLAAADIFISPSDTVYGDNQFQVLQAMGRGIPVIATDDEAYGYIDHGRTGFRLKRGCLPLSYQALSHYFPFIPHHVRSLIVSQGIAVDVQQMIEYLALLIEDTSLRKTIGNAAAQYVLEHHQFAKIAEKYENLWYNLREKVSSIRLQTPVFGTHLNDEGWLKLLLSPISQAIDGGTPLQITSCGEILLETQNLIIYEEMNAVIFPPVILEILNLARTVTSLSDITHELLQLSDPEDAKDLVPNIAYHTMWCLKQGLISQQNGTARMSVSKRSV